MPNFSANFLVVWAALVAAPGGSSLQSELHNEVAYPYGQASAELSYFERNGTVKPCGAPRKLPHGRSSPKDELSRQGNVLKQKLLETGAWVMQLLLGSGFLVDSRVTG